MVQSFALNRQAVKRVAILTAVLGTTDAILADCYTPQPFRERDVPVKPHGAARPQLHLGSARGASVASRPAVSAERPSTLTLHSAQALPVAASR